MRGNLRYSSSTITQDDFIEDLDRIHRYVFGGGDK